MTDWNFDILTNEEKQRVRELHDIEKFAVLKDYLKLKGVFTKEFCGTCKNNETVKKWVEWAIENGKI